MIYLAEYSASVKMLLRMMYGPLLNTIRRRAPQRQYTFAFSQWNSVERSLYCIRNNITLEKVYFKENESLVYEKLKCEKEHFVIWRIFTMSMHHAACFPCTISCDLDLCLHDS